MRPGSLVVVGYGDCCHKTPVAIAAIRGCMGNWRMESWYPDSNSRGSGGIAASSLCPLIGIVRSPQDPCDPEPRFQLSQTLNISLVLAKGVVARKGGTCSLWFPISGTRGTQGDQGQWLESAY